MELRETLAHQSPYGDGLSFGQGSPVGHPFTSSKFPTVNETDEPSDSVAFRDGTVHPGEAVSFNLIITDTSPVSPFLLLQQPTRIVAGARAPPGHASARRRRLPDHLPLRPQLPAPLLEQVTETA